MFLPEFVEHLAGRPCEDFKQQFKIIDNRSIGNLDDDEIKSATFTFESNHVVGRDLKQTLLAVAVGYAVEPRSIVHGWLPVPASSKVCRTLCV